MLRSPSGGGEKRSNSVTASAPVWWTVERIAISAASRSSWPVLCRSAKILCNCCSNWLEAFSQAAAVVFFLRCRFFLRRSSAADLGVDVNERANELLEAAKLRNFALGLFLSGGSWKRLGYGLAPIFVSQSRVRAMHRITGLMTPAVGLAATAAGIGDGTATQIAQTGDPLDEIGSSGLKVL